MNEGNTSCRALAVSRAIARNELTLPASDGHDPDGLGARHCLRVARSTTTAVAQRRRRFNSCLVQALS